MSPNPKSKFFWLIASHRILISETLPGSAFDVRETRELCRCGRFFCDLELCVLPVSALCAKDTRMLAADTLPRFLLLCFMSISLKDEGLMRIAKPTAKPLVLVLAVAWHIVAFPSNKQTHNVHATTEPADSIVSVLSPAHHSLAQSRNYLDLPSDDCMFRDAFLGNGSCRGCPEEITT